MNIPRMLGDVVECWVGYDDGRPVVLVLEEASSHSWLLYYDYAEFRNLRLIYTGRVLPETTWPRVVGVEGLILYMASVPSGVFTSQGVLMVLERVPRRVCLVMYDLDSSVSPDLWTVSKVVRLRSFWQPVRTSAAIVMDDD
jgi:hypothetical protein